MKNVDTIHIAINGARGRMGQRLVALARDDARYRVVAALDRDTPAADMPPGTLRIDAIADFSSDSGAARCAQLAVAHRAALLVGTTGLSPNTASGLARGLHRKRHLALCHGFDFR